MTATSLERQRIRQVLDHLHGESRKDFWQFSKFCFLIFRDLFSGKKRIFSEIPETRSHAFRNIYISIGEEEGKCLYLLARSVRARNIVEFGTSFGISTIYLAAAVLDNGGGRVISTEIEMEKVEKANENIRRAGLDDLVEIRPGNALKTLKDLDMDIDLLFLDGWKQLYLPLVRQLSDRLHANSLVLADDVIRYKKALKEYCDYMDNPFNGFTSMILPLGDGMQCSLKTC